MLALALTSAALAQAQDSAQDRPLVIGVAGPMLGPLSDSGKAMAAGAQLALRDLDKSGGQPFRLIIENDESSTAGARKAADALIAKSVRIVIGHYTSAATLAASELYARSNVMLIAPSATLPKLTAQKKLNIVRMAPPEEAQGAFAGQWLAREFPAGRIAILRDASAQSGILAAAAKAALVRAGHKNVEDVINTAPPPAADVIYLASGSAPSAAYLNQLRASNITTIILGNDALATPEFAAAAGDSVEGIRVIILAEITQHTGAREAAARLKSEGIRDIPLALSTYTAVQLLAQAVIKTGSTEPATLAQALRGKEAIETIIGPLSFDENGERREQLFAIAVWKKAADGKFIFMPE